MKSEQEFKRLFEQEFKGLVPIPFGRTQTATTKYLENIAYSTNAQDTEYFAVPRT